MYTITYDVESYNYLSDDYDYDCITYTIDLQELMQCIYYYMLDKTGDAKEAEKLKQQVYDEGTYDKFFDEHYNYVKDFFENEAYEYYKNY